MPPSAEWRSETHTPSRLLEAAAQLLLEEGSAALSARRVSSLAGVSTQGLYTHFGSMGNLVTAVVDEGFRRLGQTLDDIAPTDDPVADLAIQSRAHVHYARAQPALYGVMFGSIPLGSYRLTGPEELKRGRYTLEKVAVTMERAIAAERFRKDVPFFLANRWWTTVHGYALLEAAGFLQPPGSEVKVLMPLLEYLFVGMGDDPARVQASLDVLR